MKGQLPRETVEAIVAGDHGDAFAVLGMHRTDGGVAVRAFLPGAAAVAVIEARTGQRVATLERLDDDGFFAGLVAGRGPFPYRLAVDWPGGASEELEDPYRFPPVLGELDVHLFAEGRHLEVDRKLGAHLTTLDGVAGTAFAVWAPNAKRVSVVGAFNHWDGRRHPMRKRVECGIWEIFLPGVGEGALYKYELKTAWGDLLPLKADPVAFRSEHPPRTASVVADLERLRLDDAAWMRRRAERNQRHAPISIYEVHLGSWKRVPGEGERYLTWRELAQDLVPYARHMGFTHIELLPISEFPFDGSWGYQPIGLFAPTSRFGPPEDFAAFIEACHHHDVGLIIDWVPGHFPNDPHGLVWFDGTHLYEHADPRKGQHMDWGTLIYNFGRNEVANFLYANALFWIDRYHVDGLRVDAVASMLYLDYSRKADEWIPNQYGGNENLEAIDFLKRMNELVHLREGAVTFAEESTAWPAVSRPTYLGGLGFSYKWNMGWMHDTLVYMSKEPIHRKHHHDQLTFGLLYAWTENFVLPLSHDEVVHGKGSLLGRMPGDRWQKFANLRCYFGFMWTYPGKKLLFMGGEFGQEREWNHDASLDWHLTDDPLHRGVQTLLRDLNHLYREVRALHVLDCEAGGFQWIDCQDWEHSVISYLRFDDDGGYAVVVCNFTPVVREAYRVGVPRGGWHREAINTDAAPYGGGNVGNGGGVMAEETPWHGRPFSVSLTLPPLATLVLLPA